MIIAGEASGDLHGANLARAIKAERPDVELFGIGGSGMRAAGVDTIVDNAELAVVGVYEILTHLGVIIDAFLRMKRILKSDPPDLLVLIDYPEFNLKLAKVARRAGVKVCYYISPQIWAWRSGRVRKIARLVDRMLVVFPFEEEFYREAGVPCEFVGHPLLDAVNDMPPKEELAARLGLDHERPIYGLLPGSRKKEVGFHLDTMLASYRLLKKDIPGLQAVLPIASTLTRDDITPHLSPGDDVVLVEGDTPSVMAVMDAAVVASGTATLQVALYGKPMVIIYKLSELTYRLGRLLVKVEHIGMVNLVSGREVVPELIQHDATAENIYGLIYRCFYDKAYYDKVKDDLKYVEEKLGGAGASARAAEAVIGMLEKNGTV